MIWLRVLYYSWKYRSWPTRHGGKWFWIVPPQCRAIRVDAGNGKEMIVEVTWE